MYESCFQLERRPFVAAPQLESYFPAQSIESARQTLTRGIERGAGPGLVIGPAGTGKTLLCHKLARQFRSSAAVALLSNSHLCTRRALLQLILFELGLPCRGLDEGDLRLSLIDHVSSPEVFPHGMLLLVDEAHVFPYKLLEEIRMLSNLVSEGQARVHIVLAGNSILEERFTSPKLEAFNQRVVARCYLDALNQEETLGYIQSQIAVAGGNAQDLFTEDAVQAIHRVTGGVPRLINQVGEHALLLAAAGGHSQLDAAGIEEAWADLQQLPAPVLSQSSSQPEFAEAVVEFGSLDHEMDPFDDVSGEPEDAPDGPVATPEIPIDAEQQLNQIEQQVEDVSQEMEGPGDISDDSVGGGDTPADSSQIEEETITEPAEAYDPFGEPFEDEEIVVVDLFAAARLSGAATESSFDSEPGRIEVQVADGEGNRETCDDPSCDEQGQQPEGPVLDAETPAPTEPCESEVQGTGTPGQDAAEPESEPDAEPTGPWPESTTDGSEDVTMEWTTEVGEPDASDAGNPVGSQWDASPAEGDHQEQVANWSESGVLAGDGGMVDDLAGPIATDTPIPHYQLDVLPGDPVDVDSPVIVDSVISDDTDNASLTTGDANDGGTDDVPAEPIVETDSEPATRTEVAAVSEPGDSDAPSGASESSSPASSQPERSRELRRLFTNMRRR